MDAPRMKMDENNVTQIMLNLILETIYLLTGEDYEVMRTSGDGDNSCVFGKLNRRRGQTTNPSHLSMKQEKNDKKILELTNQVIHILTGKVWKYLGQTTHCDYIKLEDFPSTRSRDGTYEDPPNGGKEEPNFHEVAKESIHQTALKPDLFEEPRLPDPDTFTPPLIKEEPLSAEEHLPHLEVSKSRQHISQVDKVSHADRRSGFYTPADDTRYISIVVKEEEEEEGDVQQPDLTTSTNQIQTTSSEMSDEWAILESLDKNLTTFGNTFSALSNHEPLYQATSGEEPCSHYGNVVGKVGDLTLAGLSDTADKSGPQTNLGKHLMILRKGKTFFCFECGKSSSWRSVLVHHQRIHTGEKPFSCLACGKCFNSKSHLILHQRTHTGEKPYSCSECGKSFTCSSHLVTHRRIHTGEKPYSCSECGKSFISNSNLIRHQKFHTGDKPYSCPDCGKCYRYNSDLARHQRMRPGGKPYSCSECGVCYFSKCALAVHLQSHGLAPCVL